MLAKAVLEGETHGYTCHPQLNIFRNHLEPVAAIHCYLQAVLQEAFILKYHVDVGKIDTAIQTTPHIVTEKQLTYEWEHLLKKLKVRNNKLYQQLVAISNPDLYSLIKSIPSPTKLLKITS